MTEPRLILGPQMYGYSPRRKGFEDTHAMPQVQTESTWRRELMNGFLWLLFWMAVLAFVFAVILWIRMMNAPIAKCSQTSAEMLCKLLPDRLG